MFNLRLAHSLLIHLVLIHVCSDVMMILRGRWVTNFVLGYQVQGVIDFVHGMQGGMSLTLYLNFRVGPGL